MVGAIERIENELAEIKEAIADLAEEFNLTYENYLAALGEATGKQLILAGYHLCTQKEPEAFLKLSFSSREKMQQEMRLLTKKATEKLHKLLKPEKERMSSTLKLLSILNLTKEVEPNINLETKERGAETNSINIEPSQLFPVKVNSGLPQPLKNEIVDEDVAEEDVAEEDVAEEDVAEEDVAEEDVAEEDVVPEETETETEEKKIENPEELAIWQNRIERSIPKILKNLSQDSNILLKKAGILPKKLPPQVLEAAAQIEMSDSPVAGPPNLLNLLIETEEREESESEEKSRDVTKVTAINLRLSEIEFADARVTAWRKEISKLSGRLNQLQRSYNKKQRELAVIEAESAWRASWHEE
ncbi:MAG: hypothetical protein SXA11_23590 [Cyanobacteriota bacterium]|nr:hypothetical protein [Cyanobacteriota bacterium]